MIDLDSLFVVAIEANGNITVCNKHMEEILLFAQDHRFDYVVEYDGYPEFTLYRILDCPTFQHWIEKLATQWCSIMNA